jgi:hypothetical protein
VDGVLVGSTTRFPLNVSTTYQQVLALGANANRMAPAAARHLRLRLITSRNSGTGAFTMDVADGQRYTAQPYGGVFGDFTDPTKSPGIIQQRGGLLLAYPDASNVIGNGYGSGVIGPHLMALEFVYTNIPAGATTELLPSSTSMTLAGVPRVILPWDCSIVGMSYRINGAPTAGTINLQATAGGSNVWSAFGALGTGMATGDAVSQAISADVVTAGTGIGVQAVTSGGYLPTTRHIHVALWLAVSYTGA